MRTEAASSGVAFLNPINPPRFVTNKTIKKEYMDAARTWIEMMIQLAMEDPKNKSHVSAAGHLLYMAGDGTAKQMIKQAEKSKLLTLKGIPEDTTRELLGGSIINIISRESPTDAVRAEVDVLS